MLNHSKIIVLARDPGFMPAVLAHAIDTALSCILPVLIIVLSRKYASSELVQPS